MIEFQVLKIQTINQEASIKICVLITLSNCLNKPQILFNWTENKDTRGIHFAVVAAVFVVNDFFSIFSSSTAVHFSSQQELQRSTRIFCRATAFFKRVLQ